MNGGPVLGGSRVPSWTIPLAATAGIVGGAAILAAFVPGLPWTADAFQLRLVLYNAGAIAIIAVVSQRHGPGVRSMRAVAAAAIVGNAWYLVMVVLSLGRPQFPEPDPDFRLVGFFAGAAMWLCDAAFGAVTVRSRTISRPAAVVLAVGSALAFSGMDRLGLSSGTLGWLFTPLSLAGIALNGSAWIVIGIALLRGDRIERQVVT